VGLYLLVLAGLVMQLRPAEGPRRFARILIMLFFLQMGLGALNLLMLAPIWMQMIHLLTADLVWIALVLMTAAALEEGVPQADFGPSPLPATAAASRATWRDYLALTKPRVISLLLFTALMGAWIAAGTAGEPAGPLLYLTVAIGLYASAGAANAINMVLERDLDLRMARTSTRPTVTQVVSPRAALQFALALMALAFGVLWMGSNLLAAMLALAGLAFYVIVYTLILKRRTWANIVIGGAAGAFPPLVGWAAVTGDLSPLAWVLFGIIFLWTPVHFWALAILIKDEYARAGVPMLPVVRGERATVTQIAVYTALTAAISVLPFFLRGGDGGPGWGYLIAALLLNGLLAQRAVGLFRRPDAPHARSLFKYSMVYLALLFLALAVDTSMIA
jgi:protoheme IX farnesyltransferase